MKTRFTYYQISGRKNKTIKPIYQIEVEGEYSLQIGKEVDVPAEVIQVFERTHLKVGDKGKFIFDVPRENASGFFMKESYMFENK